MFDKFIKYVENGVHATSEMRSRNRKSYSHISNHNKAAYNFNKCIAEEEYEQELEIAKNSRPIININLGDLNINELSRHLTSEQLDILAEKIVSGVESKL